MLPVAMQPQVLDSGEPSSSVGMLEQLAVAPLSVVRWAQDRTTVTFVRVTEQLSLIASQGPGHPESRSFYAEQAPTTCTAPNSVIYWDLSGLISTDLRVVSTCLGVGKDNRHNIAQVHICYRSPMIGMAVTVANMALNGLIQLHRDPEPFHESLRAAVLGRTP